jgi:hypothetical protein
MNPKQKIILISFLLLLNSCITPFIPKTIDNKEMIVVDGLITDQPGKNTIKLSNSFPLGTGNTPLPIKGCIVTVTDDLGNTFNFTETVAGTYVSDSAEFQGLIGRSYTLHINTNSYSNNHTFESLPMEMKPVPPIDSVNYEKVTIAEADKWTLLQEGCQVYLNTHDPTNQCEYYRWTFIETWEFHLPYPVTNRICWISANSELINIKDASVLNENKIYRYPLNFISNQTDKLSVKYSMLVKQYSLNKEEYLYWEQLQKLSEKVGSLYDIIPSSVTNNVYCVDDPNEKVLGYFSVSAISSKRIFIKDHFSGLVNLYTHDACGAMTVPADTSLPNLNIYVWIIGGAATSGWLITYDKGCADCTVRGTNIPPYFWTEDK